MQRPETIISSRGSVWFQRFRKALDEHDREIVIEGPKAAADAIAAGWKPIAIASATTSRVPEQGAPLLRFSPKLMTSLSDTVTPQGVLALFERPEVSAETLFEDLARTLVALDRIQDPGNVGTIVRLARAFDAGGVIVLEGTADPFGPKALRASAGAIAGIPIATMSRRELLETAGRMGTSIHATVADRGASSSIPANATILVFGSEGSGVSDEILAAAVPVTIPISPEVDSINVAAAAAILLAGMQQRRRETS